MLSYERESKSRGRGRTLKTKRPNGRNKRGGRGRKRGGREADRFPGGREGPAGGRAPPRPASSPRPVPGRARNCQVREKVPRSLLFLLLFLFPFVKAPLVTALSQAVQRGQMQRGREGACVCVVWLFCPLRFQYRELSSSALFSFSFAIISSYKKVARTIQRFPVYPLLKKLSPIFHICFLFPHT